MSTPFPAAHATGDTWQAALNGCADALASATTPASDGTDQVGLVFATDAAAGHLREVEARLREATGCEHWIGTVGIGICAAGVESFDVPAVAAMIARFPAGSAAPYAMRGTTTPFGEGVDAPAFALVHASPQAADLPERLKALAAATQTGFVMGGVTSSRGDNELLATGTPDADISGLALAADVSVMTQLTQGCSPVGPRRRITRAQDNILVELDGRPALDCFKEDIGELLSRDLRRVGGLIFAALPVKGSDTGDYLVRNLVGIDPTHGAVAIGEHVDEGDEVLFCRRDHDSAVADLQRMLDELGAQLDGPPRGAVYYSCLARGPSLFGSDSQELGQIADALGDDVPLVGFFGNGEISHDRLYAYTGVLVVFP